MQPGINLWFSRDTGKFLLILQSVTSQNTAELTATTAKITCLRLYTVLSYVLLTICQLTGRKNVLPLSNILFICGLFIHAFSKLDYTVSLNEWIVTEP
jgi:hypothetical protein